MSYNALNMARAEIQEMADEAGREIEALKEAGQYDDSPMAPYLLAKKRSALDALSAIDRARGHAIRKNLEQMMPTNKPTEEKQS